MIKDKFHSNRKQYKNIPQNSRINHGMLTYSDPKIAAIIFSTRRV